jgi:hypothetical protein
VQQLIKDAIDDNEEALRSLVHLGAVERNRSNKFFLIFKVKQAGQIRREG